MTVKVEDGSGGSATIAVTLNVTDRNEPPLAPDAPTVEATTGSATSLDVSWTAPSNTGRPEITFYDLQYKKTIDSTWADGPLDVAITSASIPGLVGGDLLRRAGARHQRRGHRSVVAERDRHDDGAASRDGVEDGR